MQLHTVLFEAIALRKSVSAIYNRAHVELAPHILYTRHGEMYLDAVTISRDGQPPREIKLSTFKVSGLRELALAAGTFRPQPPFDPGAEKYAGVTLFAVETG